MRAAIRLTFLSNIVAYVCRPRARKLGIMSIIASGKFAASGRLGDAGRRRPVPQPSRGSGNCVNCPIALSSRFPGPYYGAQEFPVVERLSGAISCRVVSEAGIRQAASAKPVAEIAEIAEITHPSPDPRGNDRDAAAGHSLTPRTPVPRLRGLCLSGPLRSELSARSADRGRVVPVLDRLIRRPPIAPFAPSFP